MKKNKLVAVTLALLTTSAYATTPTYSGEVTFSKQTLNYNLETPYSEDPSQSAHIEFNDLTANVVNAKFSRISDGLTTSFDFTKLISGQDGDLSVDTYTDLAIDGSMGASSEIGDMYGIRFSQSKNMSGGNSGLGYSLSYLRTDIESNQSAIDDTSFIFAREDHDLTNIKLSLFALSKVNLSERLLLGAKFEVDLIDKITAKTFIGADHKIDSTNYGGSIDLFLQYKLKTGYMDLGFKSAASNPYNDGSFRVFKEVIEDDTTDTDVDAGDETPEKESNVYETKVSDHSYRKNEIYVRYNYVF